ncbi:MAG: hypothetical protein Q9203_005482 [Teloschistes exilis]
MAGDRTGITGIYTALEDSLQDKSWLVLGPRRHPPVPARAANTNVSIAIQTAVGFSTLETDDYVEAVQELSPDIVLGLADYEYSKTPGVKRLEKMGDRTLEWTQAMLKGLDENTDRVPRVAFFAPVLPIEAGQQSFYLETLTSELADRIAGWTIYDSASVDAVPAKMQHLPRLALTNVRGPHDVLDQVSLGIDAFVLAFIGSATDRGLAFTFNFPPSESCEDGRRLELGINLWTTTYTIITSWTHSSPEYVAAFVRALLSMIERTSTRDFKKNYLLVQGKAQGYQIKSGPSESRRNPQSFRSLNDAEAKVAQTIAPNPTAEGTDLEGLGFAELLA